MTQAKTATLTDAALREAALAYVARYGGTQAALSRALDRRIRRWAEAHLALEGADREAIGAQAAILRRQAAKVVASLTDLGAVDDQAFAESRARRLRRAGRSRRAVLAHLAAKGVDADKAGAAVPEDDAAELAAALAFARRRRVGPFSVHEDELPPEQAARVLAAFGRAGFSGAVARRILAYDREEAEQLLLANRQTSGG
ncbi:RecX family transcriptional regulator [Acidisoma silvae]|uniref:Regulatory protein RecX n=1 Tax=Acidisoma silvae TaxID=2802396 RepID=A0A963YPC7_9PROT|nr:RecX family transcriptional regulator [Acidisoma silvae]MCB8874193.1 RecX family transcriptional regulator [Acidisoma silvae]